MFACDSTSARFLALSLGMGLALFAGCSDPAGSRLDGGMGDADSGVLTDELSMPEIPTVALERFTPSQTCGSCHTRHYLEWKTSMHSYAMVDPVYQRLVELRQAEFGGTQDRFCLQCHTPIGTRSGDIQPGFLFAELAEITLEGVNCETCHRVRSIQRAYNSGHVLDDTGPMRGPIPDPAVSEYHLSEYSPIFEQSKFCGACHDVIEVSGLSLERPFAEWQESPAARTDQNCQSCHMPIYEGRATSTAPVRPDLHEHRFLGVDLPLTDDFFADPAELDALRTRVADLLDGSATITLDAAGAVTAGNQLDVFINIKNNIPAHNLPTGSTFLRQVWLEVVAADGSGQIIYQTGHLDTNGDLRDHFSEFDAYGDQDLIVLGSRLVDGFGTPVLLPWQATEHFSNSLSPLYDRTYTLFIPTEPTTLGPIDITARLRFRSFPPHLLRTLGLADKVAKLEIFDIDAAALTVTVTSP
jgi:hypothetical protein